MSRKEEILNKHDTSRKYIEQTCRPELFAAMDQYTKEVAIGFLLDFVGKLELPKGLQHIKEGSTEDILINLPSTIEKRYQLYLNHLNHTAPSPLH